MDELAGFRQAGRTLFSLGLVRQAEGNLSTFDGGTLRITRTGSSLGALSDEDVVSGSLDEELASASSDAEVHRRIYRDRGPGAIVHAHPTGSVPEEGGGPGGHGVYAYADSLERAVEAAVERARELARDLAHQSGTEAAGRPGREPGEEGGDEAGHEPASSRGSARRSGEERP